MASFEQKNDNLQVILSLSEIKDSSSALLFFVFFGEIVKCCILYLA